MVTYLNNPEAVLAVHVPVSHQDLEFQHAALAVVSQIVVGWSDLLRSEMKVVEIRGGLTNVLYAIENTRNGEKVLMRIFGLGTDLFIDRSIENLVFAHLSQQGMAPVFHGLFENGRIEGFLTARNLIPEEMCDPKVASHAAYAMAQLHMQAVPLPDACSMWTKNEHMIHLVESESYNLSLIIIYDLFMMNKYVHIGCYPFVCRIFARYQFSEPFETSSAPEPRLV
jgi:hypothetical protein